MAVDGQNVGQEIRDIRLVVDDENPLRDARVHDLRNLGLGQPLRGRDGEPDDEDRPPPHLALDLDASAVRLHDPLTQGQPEPGSLAGGLRREEWLEDSRSNHGRNPGPGIGDREAHPGSRRI